MATIAPQPDNGMDKKPPHPEPPPAGGEAPDDQRVYPRDLEYPGPGAVGRVEEIETGVGLDARRSRALAKVFHDAVREGLTQQNREMRLCFRAVYNMLGSVGGSLGDRIGRLEKKADERHAMAEERHDKAERKADERHAMAEERHDKAERKADERHAMSEERHAMAERKADERHAMSEERHAMAERKADERHARSEERHAMAERKAEERHDKAERKADERHARSEERHAMAERKADERHDKAERKADERFEQVDKKFEQVDKRFEQVDKRFAELRKLIMWVIALGATVAVSVLAILVHHFDSALDRMVAINQNPPALVVTAPSPQPSGGEEEQAGDPGGNAGAMPDSGVEPVPPGAASPADGAGGGGGEGSNGG